MTKAKYNLFTLIKGYVFHFKLKSKKDLHKKNVHLATVWLLVHISATLAC